MQPNDAIYMATQIWVTTGLSYGLVARRHQAIS